MKEKILMEKQKQSKREIIIIILAILILITSLIMIFMMLQCSRGKGTISDRDVSDNQSIIDLDLDHRDKQEGYTELMGFGCLNIDEDYPYIYLINPDDNQVYLSFDVYKDEDLLYSSNLVQPGMMEEFNIYDCLNAGKHTLIYSIASYDMDNKAVLWSGIKQKQDISITK